MTAEEIIRLKPGQPLIWHKPGSAATERVTFLRMLGNGERPGRIVVAAASGERTVNARNCTLQ